MAIFLPLTKSDTLNLFGPSEQPADSVSMNSLSATLGQTVSNFDHDVLLLVMVAREGLPFVFAQELMVPSRSAARLAKDCGKANNPNIFSNANTRAPWVYPQVAPGSQPAQFEPLRNAAIVQAMQSAAEAGSDRKLSLAEVLERPGRGRVS